MKMRIFFVFTIMVVAAFFAGCGLETSPVTTTTLPATTTIDFNLYTVDADSPVGQYTSIKVDSNNKAHISYYDVKNGRLKYARGNASSWETFTVDNNGVNGKHTSLILNSNQQPRISYYDVNNAHLKYASFNGSSWQT